jgi:DNA-binding transcriptional LysR family regulator
MLNVNLEYYKIFYYATKTGSFTNAAEQLCISQPAVSQGIKVLEKNLGSKLFIRTSKGVELTPEGKVLYSYVERGYEYILTGEKTFKKMLDFENGEIRIGASDMTLEFYLLPYLEHFHKLFPKIKVTVTNGPTPETLKHLYAGKIDFGIVSSPFEVKKDSKVTKVQEIQDVFVAGAGLLELKNRKVKYKELEELPIICLEHNTSTRKYIDQYLEENNVVLEPEFELATSNMIVQFATKNLGVGCVVSDFAREKIKEGVLFQLNFEEAIPKRHICVITSERNPISTAAKKLLALMNNDT